VIVLTKRININVGEERHKQLKRLSIEKDNTSINELVVEAVDDLFKKYKDLLKKYQKGE
jgi:predicted DNA-binding helix-hairpin-helix protein